MNQPLLIQGYFCRLLILHYHRFDHMLRGSPCTNYRLYLSNLPLCLVWYCCHNYYLPLFIQWYCFYMLHFESFDYSRMSPNFLLPKNRLCLYSFAKLLVLFNCCSLYLLLSLRHLFRRVLCDLVHYFGMFPSFQFSRHNSSCYSSVLYSAYYRYNYTQILFVHYYFYMLHFELADCSRMNPTFLLPMSRLYMIVYCMTGYLQALYRYIASH